MTTTHLLRPLARVVAGVAAAVGLAGLLSTISGGDEIPLFFLHLVVLVLVAGTAYLLDDDAKQVTDLVPRSLLRRRIVLVLVGFSALAGGWGLLTALLQWWAPSAPLPALAWESAGLAWLAVAASAVVSRRGEPEPGNLVASAGAVTVVGVLVLQPLLHVTVLVNDPGDPAHSGWWTGIVVAAATTFAISSRDGRIVPTRRPARRQVRVSNQPCIPACSAEPALTNGDCP